MRAKRLHTGTETTWALVLDKGDEVVHELRAHAVRERLGGSRFTAIGAFSDAELGFFDRAAKDYLRIRVDEQVEVLSLVGDVARAEDGPQVHAHVVLGKRDGSTIGGHLLAAHVWPTLELLLVESPRALRRRHDPETGLALIDLDAVEVVEAGERAEPVGGERKPRR